MRNLRPGVNYAFAAVIGAGTVINPIVKVVTTVETAPMQRCRDLGRPPLVQVARDARRRNLHQPADQGGDHDHHPRARSTCSSSSRRSTPTNKAFDAFDVPDFNDLSSDIQSQIDDAFDQTSDRDRLQACLKRAAAAADKHRIEICLDKFGLSAARQRPLELRGGPRMRR